MQIGEVAVLVNVVDIQFSQRQRLIHGLLDKVLMF